VVSEIAGVRVGHWTDAQAGTGCTVVLVPEGTVGAMEARGGGPATRDVEVLSPVASVSAVTALLLSGGSAFGLDAASGVVLWCEERGLGHDTGTVRVPIVPTACIYDLGISGNLRRPGRDEGYAACEAARPGPHAVGSVGAGTGATVGKLLAQAGWCKGGLGAASRRLHDGATVAALAVVNAWGDVLDESGAVLAGAFDASRGGFVRASERVIDSPPTHPRLMAPSNTTLACVVTDGRLTKVEAAAVARMAHAGMARAVSPVHTPLDGDVAFCLATGTHPTTAFACGVAAAEAVSEAIRDAVRSATAVRGVLPGAQRALSTPG
jgi:L-aminopeptidase/D-esterase-like protein